eukprot:TRINITY_DN4040_c0_g1_i1.p1 TRINITY_DN4040_c0_g1~~TRINITY_DN4040_c0_g1_i1.p1  ORF type:complete len:163 (-),score=37.79 TRINITY_DN4040_c0_g1_i1:594-1082(-)
MEASSQEPDQAEAGKGKRARDDDSVSGDQDKRLRQNFEDAAEISRGEGPETSTKAISGDPAEESQQIASQLPANSEEMEAAIQQIKERIDAWTAQVSGLLETGKAAFMNAHNKWEEQVISVHQKQIEAWEDEVELLRNLDAMNEDFQQRLGSAQIVISKVHS